MSSKKLDEAELLKTGALKTQCDETLVCVAHGLLNPCDLCDLEGTSSSCCRTCHHVYVGAVPVMKPRPCASLEEFRRTGAIAFKKDAVESSKTELTDEERQTLLRIGGIVLFLILAFLLLA